MPEYLFPGVYVEEIPTGPRPIEGVSTHTAGMAGQTERGPEQARLVTSWAEYQRWYGGFLPPERSYLPYAVQGFFDNGGQRLYVARVAGAGADFARGDLGALHIGAIGRGAWGNRLFARIRESAGDEGNPNRDPDLFGIDVLYYGRDSVPPLPLVDPLDPANALHPNRREPDQVESWDRVSHVAGAADSVEAAVNGGSRLVRVWLTGTDPGPLPVDRSFASLAGGADGREPELEDFQGDAGAIYSADERGKALLGTGRGLEALETIDEISLLAAPDEVRTATLTQVSPITAEVIDQCERRKDRFGVVSAAAGGSDTSQVRPPRDTSYAAFYYPWIAVQDPASFGPVLVPPTGHVAGLIARTDIERGVHKAPANEVVRGAIDLEFPVTRTMQDTLNPRGVNCIRDFRGDGRGIRLWGARTMSSDRDWKYISVRRLLIFVEQSIVRGTRWIAFEANDAPVWGEVRHVVTDFLIGVWRSGALMGRTPDEAFFVRCDRTTMTQDDIDNGRLVCLVGVAPVRPAEFIILRIGWKAANAPA